MPVPGITHVLYQVHNSLLQGKPDAIAGHWTGMEIEQREGQQAVAVWLVKCLSCKHNGPSSAPSVFIYIKAGHVVAHAYKSIAGEAGIGGSLRLPGQLG